MSNLRKTLSSDESEIAAEKKSLSQKDIDMDSQSKKYQTQLEQKTKEEQMLQSKLTGENEQQKTQYLKQVHDLDQNISGLNQKLRQTEQTVEQEKSEMASQQKQMKSQIDHEHTLFNTEHEKTKQIGVLEGKIGSL